ncbi:hypothetical protein [Roseitalea sp. MMSF_3516]|uniref:hypothetical protein n=1 Tax=Roseitalea sp. MMSF_3516 TaxID=3046719 RepID=UPI00274025D9|nr:hypothetical protein [Roseitalea sp. MMSF_3516]
MAHVSSSAFLRLAPRATGAHSVIRQRRTKGARRKTGVGLFRHRINSGSAIQAIANLELRLALGRLHARSIMAGAALAPQ